MTQGELPAQAIVLDTNIVLDLLVFAEPAVQPLRAALAMQRDASHPATAGPCASALRWIATLEMREELARVLTYTHIAARLQFHQHSPAQVLAGYDAQVQLLPAAPRAPFVCKDADDQRFIDLAVAHKAVLLSKDHAVLCMARRLQTLGVAVRKIL